MASPRKTLTPARRAIVDRFAALSVDEQSALRALAHRARRDLWDYLEAKGWGAGHTFSAAPAAPAPIRRSVLVDRAAFEADGTAKCNALSEQLQRARRSA